MEPGQLRLDPGLVSAAASSLVALRRSRLRLSRRSLHPVRRPVVRHWSCSSSSPSSPHKERVVEALSRYFVMLKSDTDTFPPDTVFSSASLSSSLSSRTSTLALTLCSVVLLMIFLHQASADHPAVWCGPSSSNAVRSTVNEFTDGTQIRHFVMAITSISRAVEDKSAKKILAADGGAEFPGQSRAFARETIEIDDVWNAGMCNA
jgi:hypothetical protein